MTGRLTAPSSAAGGVTEPTTRNISDFHYDC
ncbi:hypothetical protein GGE06_002034 [Streptomyces sp. SFB5A]|jgi:hypothetical protein|uniref:Uncharacterized protein n=1 Tax=Streptomyces nymphaeiformis TaxID=2663842 RepID=A0A7W7TXG1_9ACTN|nr:hypothetical protein [Streptomyces nymphaeiformis]